MLELLFVYGFDWGLAGSAWGTVIAQAGMGAAFVWVQARASGWEPPNLERIRSLLEIGGEIAVRTTALLGSFLVASAVLARVGAVVARPRTRSRSSCSSSSRSCSTRSRSPGR